MTSAQEQAAVSFDSNAYHPRDLRRAAIRPCPLDHAAIETSPKTRKTQVHSSCGPCMDALSAHAPHSFNPSKWRVPAPVAMGAAVHATTPETGRPNASRLIRRRRW